MVLDHLPKTYVFEKTFEIYIEERGGPIPVECPASIDVYTDRSNGSVSTESG